MTAQVSPASGTTTYAYNEHGELTAQIDARGIAMSRAVDALDRPIAVSYPTPDLNVSYTYDDPGVSFSKGRLTRIARGTSAVDYRYDRFGRLTQDGELSYAYDPNGNPTSLVYPGGVTAVTTYDFADRPASLLAQRAGKPDQPLVSSASYLPYGPLNTLTLGNGLTETHAFTQRYFPSTITLGSLLSWTYTTDKVGNISAITDALSSANNRTYGYQDDQYFLTQGNGPWGTRAWTYDRIGNRLTETRSGTTDTYTYQLVPPPGTGHSPILASIALGAGGTKTYQYDPAGNLQQITQGTSATAFTNDDASHLGALTATSPAKGVSFTYDGRDYLTLASSAALPFLDGFETGDICSWSAALGVPVPPTCPPLPAVHPTYSSEGLLHALQRATAPQRSYVFHFAGRPVAQMDLTGTTEAWKLLTVDHLGTPIVATSTGGGLLWQGGFEPFGSDWNGAGGAGVFLRFPGQWVESSWLGFASSSIYYNLHRWYSSETGRFIEADPIGISGGVNAFAYAFQRPTLFKDPFGLKPTNEECCAKAYDRGLFRDNPASSAGGIVVCCEGQKAACANPDTLGNPLFDRIGELIIGACIIEHETSHFNDVQPCKPNCDVERPDFKIFRSQGRAECSSSRIEVGCLSRRKPQCGNDQVCIAQIEKRIGQIKSYAQSYGRCPGI